MTNYLRQLIAGGVLAIAQPAVADSLSIPPIPPELQVPAEHVVFLKGEAAGTQNYICLPSGAGYAWAFAGPQATLFLRFKWIGGEIRQQITTHFLSPNPAEDGIARATWQSSLDTSAVWGRAIASTNDPRFVAPGAVPWLLVQITGAQPGPTGGQILTDTTYIHRLNTSGGIAPPAAGCTQSNIGTTVFVPYTTDYYFYKNRLK